VFCGVRGCSGEINAEVSKGPIVVPEENRGDLFDFKCKARCKSSHSGSEQMEVRLTEWPSNQAPPPRSSWDDETISLELSCSGKHEQDLRIVIKGDTPDKAAVDKKHGKLRVSVA
jgi:hypothetical protein